MKPEKSLVMVAITTLVSIGLLLSITALARGAFRAVAMFVETIGG